MGRPVKDLTTIILAAGRGTRMKSSLPKVLHPLLGKPMLRYPIDVSLNGLKAERTIVVVGHQADRVQKAFAEDPVTFVVQEPQLGSGHAVLAVEDTLRGYDGTILILSGDVPLVQARTLARLVAFHRREGSTLTVTTTRLPEPTGYGRVVRQEKEVKEIVEEGEASELVRKIGEVNAGLYCVEAPFLFSALRRLRPDNKKGEYYLTDIVRIGREEQIRVLAFEVRDSDQVMGVNTRVDLARCCEILRKRTLQRWMLEGVTIVDPHTVYLETDVAIGRDTVIHPNCVIHGKTAVGKRCTIGPNCFIAGSQIDDDVTLRAFSMVEGSHIERGAMIGPFSRIRPETRIEERAKIGNFVEVKKSVIGRGSKANHLAYVGDATVGEGVNIGAGTIFCNYDGVTKHPTIVGDGVFIGSNTELIAPLKIGDRAVIGAGSTITGDVPAEALAVSRVKQKNIAGWKRKRREKK